MCKCLYCYKELEEGQKDIHPGCALKFFGSKDVPLLDYKHEDLDQLAEQIIRAQTSLTGVQPKLSLNLSRHDGCSRLTIVGLWGDYIFKPQTESYGQLQRRWGWRRTWCSVSSRVSIRRSPNGSSSYRIPSSARRINRRMQSLLLRDWID